METFRCPTCIGVLPDAHVRRCAACGQALRRRHPRVLGDEHRIGARSLPIDRWMLDKLQGEPRRRRARSGPEVPWHGRFATSPRSAEPDLVLPRVVEPPAAATVAAAPPVLEPPVVEAPPIEATLVDAPTIDTPVVDVVAPDAEESTPAAITARDLDRFVSPVPTPAPAADPIAEPPAPAATSAAPAVASPLLTPAEPIAPAPRSAPPLVAPTVVPATPPFPTPRPIVTHEELDPEVRALVDELYEQARAELSGIDPRPETSGRVGAAPTSSPGATVTADPETKPSGGSGWVPAFIADDQQPDPNER